MVFNLFFHSLKAKEDRKAHKESKVMDSSKSSSASSGKLSKPKKE